MAYYNDTVAFERKVGIIIPTIFAFIILIGVFGNVLVVLVALNRQMRNSTNTLIIGAFPILVAFKKFFISLILRVCFRI